MKNLIIILVLFFGCVSLVEAQRAQQMIGSSMVIVREEMLDKDLYHQSLTEKDSIPDKGLRVSITNEINVGNGKSKIQLPEGDYMFLLGINNANQLNIYTNEAELVGALPLNIEKNVKGESELLFENNQLKYTEKSNSVQINFESTSISSPNQGSWCCDNHNPKHCGEIDELKDLVSTYSCEGFSTN